MDKSDVLLATDVLEEMERIMRDRPGSMEYEDDARYTWPARWDALREFLWARRGVAGVGICANAEQPIIRGEVSDG
jgi:hypothetical protein